MRSDQQTFRNYAWFTLGYNVLVIVWGALVRATGSGAGCGAHWPTCQGQIFPAGSSLEIGIEFAHRITSGVALLLVVGLVVWAARAFSKGHPARRAAAWSLVFIVIEALVGAGLVLFELVGENSSTLRAVVIALHLDNTFLLLGALGLTAWWANRSGGVSLTDRATVGGLAVGAGCLMLVGMSGAVTALGDTLFPVRELAALGEGVRNHFLVQLRAWHPLLAVFLGALVGGIAWYWGRKAARTLGATVMGLYMLQLGIGIANVVLGAPLWLQLIHLAAADTLWVAYVLLGVAVLARRDGVVG